MPNKKSLFILLMVLLTCVSFSQTQYRNRIVIPDILDYKTLKCDFHIHTVFSDGDVWPTFRVREAWREGLDAIALTDHLEYQPYKDYVHTNHDHSFNIAKDLAKELGITLIKGAEITRSMPPGHLNAIFINDGNALILDNWQNVINEVKKQGGLVNWNHPGWRGQQPDGIPKWYEEHSFLLENKILSGIEVINGIEFYPLALDWCLDKNITILGNSDVHEPVSFEYDFDKSGRRAMTLVFAKDNSSDAIKDALLNQRTVAFFNNKLYGREKFLNALFNESIFFKSNLVNTTGRETAMLQIENRSDITFQLELINEDENVGYPLQIDLMAGKTVLFNVRAKSDDVKINKKVKVNYRVKNLITGSDKALNVPLELNLNISSVKK
jgi:hypothetical protein